MATRQVKELVAQMTLDEKIRFCSGANFWKLEDLSRLDIPAVNVSDGPHGVRKQSDTGDHLGMNDSEVAICFPAGSATASSFNKETLRLLGETLGEESLALDVSTILGPAVNIKRSPLGGRNFEYYSEDPFLSTTLAESFIKGVQSKNVGTSIKHYLANNQETRRMTNSSEVDERTLREIYLASFEGAIKNGKPWTVMCAYNLVNGTYVSEDKTYLTDILRNEWGFEGYVMSDWGAVNDRVAGLAAGMDLEMPSSNGANDPLINEAIAEGTLSEETLNQSCERILQKIFEFTDNKPQNTTFDYERDHRIAEEIAMDSAVLLKNTEQTLPLKEETKVAFIGAFAQTPRYQGGGSSHINSYKVVSAIEAAKDNYQVTWAKGYDVSTETTDDALLEEAMKVAKEADVAVLFLGLPDDFESEGYDRKHMKLPANQNELVSAIHANQKNIVVVLHNGSPVEMPWLDEVKAVLEMYLGGEAVGAATVNLLYGKVNPSGRLPETFPEKLEDTPTYVIFAKNSDESVYAEGIFVGYRYYVSKKINTAFSFGHGLSYTTFAYHHLTTDKGRYLDNEEVRITVEVENTGKVFGKEVVQLYVGKESQDIIRPIRELRGFEKIALAPGEKKTVYFVLNKRAFSYWDVVSKDWVVETGSYQIQIGQSASEIILSEEITMTSTHKIKKIYTINSTMGDILADQRGQEILGAMFNPQAIDETDAEGSVVNKQMLASTIQAMPLRQLLSFTQDIKREDILGIIERLNA